MYLYNNKTIVLHELIGKEAKTIKSNDKSQIGIKGKVIDETKNTLLIETSKGIKRVTKNISTFAFKIDGRNIFIVDGKEINFRSYERIEKCIKYYKKRYLTK
ncbi:MAG: ribonuclease P protein component 1 [Candidatus Marsarchaeota archaeon]|jgi:ribonuclease P protein subunit POP4|nr:ribonuclease P protein component 1 [Candidatus Marsarchaeota archaeon]